MVLIVLGVTLALVGLGVLVASRRRFDAATRHFDRWLPARGRVVAQEGVDFAGQPKSWQQPRAVVDNAAHAGVRQSGSSSQLKAGLLTIEFKTIEDEVVRGVAQNGRPSRGYDLGLEVDVLYNPAQVGEFYQLDGPGRKAGGPGVGASDILVWCFGGLLMVAGVGAVLAGAAG